MPGLLMPRNSKNYQLQVSLDIGIDIGISLDISISLDTGIEIGISLEINISIAHYKAQSQHYFHMPFGWNCEHVFLQKKSK